MPISKCSKLSYILGIARKSGVKFCQNHDIMAVIGGGWAGVMLSRDPEGWEGILIFHLHRPHPEQITHTHIYRYICLLVCQLICSSVSLCAHPPIRPSARL